MAAPAPRKAQAEAPAVDPVSVGRAFIRHRARRRARVEHRHEQRRAQRRFWGLLGALVFVVVFLGLAIWDKIQALFGL